MPTRSSGSVQVFYPRLSREEVIRHLTDRIPALSDRLPLVKAVLFGSYARGDYSVRSDIDLLVVYAGELRADAYSVVRRSLELPGLEPHVYSVDEYHRACPTVDRMQEGGVVLFDAGPREVER
jgi:predicted nucleotidyltransferase